VLTSVKSNDLPTLKGSKLASFWHFLQGWYWVKEKIFGRSESRGVSRRVKKKIVQFSTIRADLLPFEVETVGEKLLDDRQVTDTFEQ